jgi:hypothetical protein
VAGPCASTPSGSSSWPAAAATPSRPWCSSGAEAGAELWAACDRLGDSASVTGVAAAYAGSLAAADEVVGALVHALDGGIAALVDSARDVAEADETVAFEIGRSAGGRGRHRGWDGSDGPGRGR